MKRYTAILLMLVILMGAGAWAEPDLSASSAPSEAPSSAWTAVTHPAPEVGEAAEVTPFDGTSELMENPGGAEATGDLAEDDAGEADWLSDSATLQSDAMVADQNEAAERHRLNQDSPRRLRGATTRMSLNQLRAKFPSGKYWNHAHNPGQDKALNYADGWTDVPCPENHSETYSTEMRTCNAYWPGQAPIGFQCYGFADKLGFDATGTDPETWEKRTYSGALNSLKAGDIVRFLNDRHSIFVIDVDGEEVTYADCNSGGTCVIRWDQSTTKSRLAETFTYIRVCPTDALVDDGYCHCSANLSGTYTANRQLPIYKAHRLDGEVAGYIPDGAVVSVGMAQGGLCHVSYNGINGFTRYGDLTRKAGAVLQASHSKIALTLPSETPVRVKLYCSGNLPERYFLNLEGSTGTCHVEFMGWETPTCCLTDITATGNSDGKLMFNMVDSQNHIYATCELPYTITTAHTYLTANRNALSINTDRQPSQTIRLTVGGFLPGEFSLIPLRTTNDIARLDWPGDWDGYSHDLTLTGVYPGDSKIIVGVLCDKVIRATTEIDVSITGSIHITTAPERVILNLEGVPERRVTYMLTGLLPQRFDFRIAQISSGIEMVNASDMYPVDGGFAIDVKVIGHDVVRGSVVAHMTDSKTGALVSTHTLPVEVCRKAPGSADLRLPRLRGIASEAFRNIAARSVWVPDGATYIGSRAFAGNGLLREVFLPGSVVDIASDAFDGCENLTILAPLGSAAETYALAKGFAFIPVG